MMKKNVFYFLLAGFTGFAGFSASLMADPPKKIDQAAPLLTPAAAQVQPESPPAPPPVAASGETGAPLSAPLANATHDEIARFCQNIDGQARDARFELQLRQLNVMRDRVDARIRLLEEKRKEYEDWLAKRNAFLARTQDSFVGIISKMRPDAAAAQLALVDEVAAASIILKLEPRISSAIMNELQPEKSANLMRILVSAQKVPVEKPARSTPAVTKGAP